MQRYCVLGNRYKHMPDLNQRECCLPNSSNGVNHLINSLGYEHISWPLSFKVRSKPSAAWTFLHYTAHSWNLLERLIALTSVSHLGAWVHI